MAAFVTAAFAHLRRLVRRNEALFIALAATAGALGGAGAVFLSSSAALFHFVLFGHPQLSDLIALDEKAQVSIPCLGGLILGLSGIYLQKWMTPRPVDPIEANALQGGRMSLKDSLLVAAQTVVSNGFGASVGLEAAYTQLGSGMASSVGRAFRLRRGDLRTLVACGSAGAIAAAFGAPLTGAFYAFELILGNYTPFVLAPVGAAAVSGVLVSKAFGGAGQFMSQIPISAALSKSDMTLLLLLGLICALFGILVMRAVASIERVCERLRLPRAIQPAVGGLIVGLLALAAPQVLSSGHAGLLELFEDNRIPLNILLLTLLLKTAASVVSLGTGFRGGLFFASLFIGAMIGRAFFLGVGYFNAPLAPDIDVCTLVGMAALAVAIIGTPMAMSFLALETTGSFPLSLVMLAVTSIVSIIVRRAFGYSFATWRFHLRGETIRSAQDIGWMRDLTTGKLMRADVPKAPLDMRISTFMEEFPARSTNQWVAVIGPTGSYAGLVFVPDIHLAGAKGDPASASLGKLVRLPDIFLTPDMDVKLSVERFEQSESEALAVVDNAKDRHVIGLLTEAHVLRRYTDELDRARLELAGEG
ncbi:MAG TPA: chloride channel protein [Methylocella sp.]|nr:chloride channel protein [Methylocella sp.]